MGRKAGDWKSPGETVDKRGESGQGWLKLIGGPMKAGEKYLECSHMQMLGTRARAVLNSPEKSKPRPKST